MPPHRDTDGDLREYMGSSRMHLQKLDEAVAEVRGNLDARLRDHAERIRTGEDKQEADSGLLWKAIEKMREQSHAEHDALVGQLRADAESFLNKLNEHEKLCHHRRAGINGEAVPQSRFKDVLYHPTTKIAGGGIGGGIIMWLLQQLSHIHYNP